MKNWLLISRECIESRRRGGIATANYNHIKMLINHGISVTELVAREPLVKNQCFDINYSRITLPFRDYSVDNIFIFKVLRLLLYIPYRVNILFYVLKNHKKYNVIEVADYGAEGIFLVLFPFLRKKLIIRGHCIAAFDRTSNRIRYTRAEYIFEIFQLLIAKKVICCSNALAEVYRSKFNIKTEVIYNPVNDYTNKDILHKINRKGILYLGTISIFKGTDIILKTIKTYNRKITIAGRLSNKIKLNQYSENVNYLGLVDKEKVTELLRRNKILIVSSRFENLPMVIIEAMNEGILVVGANNSGIAELINNGSTGFLYDTEDPEDLELVLKKIESLSDKEYTQITNDAKTRMNNLTSYETIYNNWNEYFSR